MFSPFDLQSRLLNWTLAKHLVPAALIDSSAVIYVLDNIFSRLIVFLFRRLSLGRTTTTTTTKRARLYEYESITAVARTVGNEPSVAFTHRRARNGAEHLVTATDNRWR